MAVSTRTKLKTFSGIFRLLIDAPRSVSFLRRTIRGMHADLVHTNTAIILSSGIAARLEGIPHVWHVRESFAEFGPLWAGYQWYMSSLSSKVICVSEAVEKQFALFIRRHKTIVIHNGIPADEFRPVSEERVIAFKRQFGLEGFLLIGVVGRLKLVRKGQDTFLRAAALLAREYPRVRFVVIGTPFPGNEMHGVALKQLGEDLGIADRVVYTGDISDMQAAYAALDISVLPSEQPEPFGGVVLESMASGKPVVGTRIGGTCEQIAHDETGLLVEPGSPQSLALALRRLVDDDSLRARFGIAGRRRFEKMFEFELFYGSIQKLYSDLTRRQ